MTRASLCLAVLLCALAPQAGRAAASFTMPIVDISPNKAGQNALIAIWSSTDLYVTKNARVDYIFPADYTIPSGLDPASCQCVFLRHTSTTAGLWAGTEITVTAGTYAGSGQLVSINLPAALYPGKFFVRFDATANFTNPNTVGLATLAVVDPTGNTTLSRGFYIRSSGTAAVSLGTLNGKVLSSAGKAMPAALVHATTYGSYPPISLSARRQWVDPLGASMNAYTTAAGSDGSYSLAIPAGTYALKAEVWNHKGGVANSQAGTSSATLSAGGTATVNFTLPSLP